MGTAPSSPRGLVYRFGVYEADTRAGELRKSGMRLKLTGQPFQVLAILLERAGDVVTRDELRLALWPQDTYVDFDHSLNTAINKLRAALGESGTNPRFVETLARRGYRFIAPVVMEERGGASSTPPSRADVVERNPAPLEPGRPRPGELDQRATYPVEGDRAPTSAEASAAKAAAEIDELPRPPRKLVRALFDLAQVMYLVLYVVALGHFSGIEREAAKFAPRLAFAIAVATLVLAAVGIPVRCFLLFAVAFDYRPFARQFRRLFPALLLFDQIWALTPFLLADRIGLGLAFAAAAGLLHLPFGQRTLVRMGYE